MAISDIYETTFDEDVQADDQAGQCPECDGHVTTNTVETVCEDCGLVIDEQPIDHGPEWRDYEDAESNPERTGAPLTPARHDRGLSTTIGRNTDANGNTLSGDKRRQLHRLRREQRRGRWRSKWEQNLARGLGEVRRIASCLELGDGVRNQACQLFRSAQEEDLLRGRSIDSMAAASVYGTIRCNGLTWTVDDIEEYARCEFSSLRNAYKVLNRELNLPTPPMRPAAFVGRFASALELPDRVRRQAEQFAETAERDGAVTGVQPTGFAAACLYTAAQETGCYVTQTDLAEVAATTPVTIRTHHNTLVDQYC